MKNPKYLMTLVILIQMLLICGTINVTRVEINQTNSSITNSSNIYKIESGDISWVMVSSCLVMLMTPALGFFYGGFVDNKTFVLLVAQCFAIFGIITVFWSLLGFSLAFGDNHSNFLGGFKYAALQNLDYLPFSYSPKIPSLLFYFYQNKFATITPALIIGSTAGRLSLMSILIFTSFWSILGYSPIAFWNWNSDGFLKKLGAIDFAGGNVVHVSAGFAGLAAAIICDKVEKIQNIPKDEKHKPSLMIIMLGTSLLWFGWFGFNGGSSLAANSQGILALVNTNIAASTGLLTYSIIGYLVHKRPSVNEMCIGAVCGLVGVTPAAGYVPIYASGIIGCVTSAICYLVVFIKEKYNLFDDRLDAFGCHGVGGVVGALLTGLFAIEKYADVNGAFHGSGILFAYQLASVVTTACWSFIISGIILIAMFYCKLLTFGSSFTELAIGESYNLYSFKYLQIEKINEEKASTKFSSKTFEIEIVESNVLFTANLNEKQIEVNKFPKEISNKPENSII